MQEKKSGKIAETCEAIVKGPVEQAGYAVWDVEYGKEGTEYTLTVTIEKRDPDDPIGLEDCEKVSRLISPLLDERDPIPDSYCLEVSSPGLERELKKEAHYRAFLGKPVTVRLYAPRAGQKSVTGLLLEACAEEITLQIGEEKVSFSKKDVAKAYAAAEELS